MGQSDSGSARGAKSQAARAAQGRGVAPQGSAAHTHAPWLTPSPSCRRSYSSRRPPLWPRPRPWTAASNTSPCCRRPSRTCGSSSPGAPGCGLCVLVASHRCGSVQKVQHFSQAAATVDPKVRQEWRCLRDAHEAQEGGAFALYDGVISGCFLDLKVLEELALFGAAHSRGHSRTRTCVWHGASRTGRLGCSPRCRSSSSRCVLDQDVALFVLTVCGSRPMARAWSWCRPTCLPVTSTARARAGSVTTLSVGAACSATNTNSSEREGSHALY